MDWTCVGYVSKTRIYHLYLSNQIEETQDQVQIEDNNSKVGIFI